MESENSVRLVKLVNENWCVWKFQLVVILKSTDLYRVVSGSEVKPCKTDDISDAEFQTCLKLWNGRDSKAQEVIVTWLIEGPMTHLLTCDSASEMWVKLLSIYEQQSEMCLHQLQQKIFNASISEQMLMTKIIGSLPDKHKHFVSAWELVSVNNKKLTELASMLLIEEERIGEKSSVEVAVTPRRCVRLNTP
ncbi:hypothetical protein PR048_007629 [Dryococelus australis]|uniref:Copia protein n=1 Tax=Dryococelus australis TaxID=614101 RepID=A0ABQ9HV72_9NEOP|nr:hypothetical protein PR048_007629 [Dryococelus australis]